MMEPCYELCWLKYGKQYSVDCIDKCNYAKVAEENRVLREELKSTNKRLDSILKLLGE